MKKLLDYLPFHFLIWLIAGILIQLKFSIWHFSYSVIFQLIIIALLILRKKIFFQILSWLFFFCLGIYLVHFSDDRNRVNYFEKYLLDDFSTILEIKKIVNSNQFSDRYYATVNQIDSVKTIGQVLVTIRKDSLRNKFQVGDQLLIKAKFISVKPAMNPHQFDYKKYLANKGIYKQIHLDQTTCILINSKQSLFTWISKFREKIKKSLEKENFSKEVLGVINALLLGERKEVSKELLNDYSRAGAIHILAISGLHVGIVLLILSWILKPIEFFSQGKFVKLIITVIFLWFFAVLAGMSSSVIRAVTMFSAVALGQFLGRSNSVVYSLILSMFVLLLINPMSLLDVGFQLSYLAVYGIVSIQPRLFQLWKPRWILIRKIWELSTVSLSAQLTVLPLSLFYFHQFPGLFLLSNLLIVPFLGLILFMGILIMILSLGSFLPEILVYIYGKIIFFMNSFVSFVSRQESFLFTDISFSFLLMLSSYLLIIFGFRFFRKRNGKRLILCLINLTLFFTILLYEKYKVSQKIGFIVFQKTRESNYGFRNQDLLYANSSNDNSIRSYKIGEKVLIDTLKKTQNYFRFYEDHILLIDSLGVYPNNLLAPVVVLQYSPRINLERLVKTTRPKQIIADGSNYKSLIPLWRKTCGDYNVPFWSTSEKGAIFLKQ